MTFGAFGLLFVIIAFAFCELRVYDGKFYRPPTLCCRSPSCGVEDGILIRGSRIADSKRLKIAIRTVS